MRELFQLFMELYSFCLPCSYLVMGNRTQNLTHLHGQCTTSLAPNRIHLCFNSFCCKFLTYYGQSFCLHILGMKIVFNPILSCLLYQASHTGPAGFCASQMLPAIYLFDRTDKLRGERERESGLGSDTLGLVYKDPGSSLLAGRQLQEQ